MEMYYKTNEDERLCFAKKAADCFKRNPDKYTYTEGDIEQGVYFAMRYGFGNDCVLVFKISEDDKVVNYCQFIEKEKK